MSNRETTSIATAEQRLAELGISCRRRMRGQPKVNEYASAPGPRNSISNCRSTIGWGWRTS